MNQLRNLQTYYPGSNSNGDPTHEYIDAVITNNTVTTGSGTNSSPYIEPIPIIFNQIKTSNIIDDCSKYYLSVIRWSVETNLPIIIPTMKLGNAVGPASGQTDYYVNMDVFDNYSNLSSGSTPISFTSAKTEQVTLDFDYRSDVTIPVPSEPQSIKDYMNNSYYYLDSVQTFLNAINSAYEIIYNNDTKIPAVNKVGQLPPLFTWNSTTGKIELDVTSAFTSYGVEVSGTPKYIRMGMSTSLYNLLNTFNCSRINSNPSTSDVGGDYVFNLTKTNNVKSVGTGGTILDVYTYIQEASSVPSWSPVSNIVFVTNSVPVNATNSGIPQFQGAQIGSSLNQNATSTILTDFEIPMEIGTEYKNISYYSPTSEFRLFDLVSNQQLNTLNIQIFWRDKYGELHPLTLRQNASASIKILIRKKDFNGV